MFWSCPSICTCVHTCVLAWALLGRAFSLTCLLTTSSSTLYSVLSFVKCMVAILFLNREQKCEEDYNK